LGSPQLCPVTSGRLYAPGKIATNETGGGLRQASVGQDPKAATSVEFQKKGSILCRRKSSTKVTKFSVAGGKELEY